MFKTQQKTRIAAKAPLWQQTAGRQRENQQEKDLPLLQIAANPQRLLQMQRQFGNRYVSQIVQKTREQSRSKSQQPSSAVVQARHANALMAKNALLNEVAKTAQVHKDNKVGLPDNLKAGIENLSGMAMDDVTVQYNSPRPAKLQAAAYTQGSDIHVAPGQEKHLPHEAWHVVQQRQGRVRPTEQIAGVQVNNEIGLEREADLMGGMAAAVQQEAHEAIPSHDRVASQDLTPIKPWNFLLSKEKTTPVYRKVIQRAGPDWKSEYIGYEPQSVIPAVETFIDHYKSVQQGELNPEIGFPETIFEPNEEEEHDAAMLLKKIEVNKKSVVKQIALEVVKEIVADAKTAEGRIRITKQIGVGGLAGFIESSILDRALPFMDVSLKSLVPMGTFRKNQGPIMGFVEGMTDVIYNACGFGIEALSGTLATPLVATAGGAYKSSFAAAKVKWQGGTKEQAAISAITTVAAESGQAMLPFAGGVFGITSGVKAMFDSSRIKERIMNLFKGGGIDFSLMKARPETMGDRRVIELTQKRLKYARILLERVKALENSKVKYKKEKEELGKAIEWLERQFKKSEERFLKTENKGKASLLTAAE
jgi:hypothetical protein